MIQRNWMIGKRIHEEELKDTRKENYGLEIIKTLMCTQLFGPTLSISYQRVDGMERA